MVQITGWLDMSAWGRRTGAWVEGALEAPAGCMIWSRSNTKPGGIFSCTQEPICGLSCQMSFMFPLSCLPGIYRLLINRKSC
jgi:hypothetical protein